MRRVGAGVVLIGMMIGQACAREQRSGTTSDSAATAGRLLTSALIRVAAPPDSATASTLTDSLTREGWVAEANRPASDTTGWPVMVVVPGDAELAKLVSSVFRQAGFEPMFIGLRPARSGIAVAVTPVNNGTHGMSARVRWALSGDRRAVLVVEDPRAVENDPVPNGFVFAREDAGLIQRDSVWDVAASPDWRRVAYARAYTTKAGESETVPPSEWHRLARDVGLMESTVRKSAFPTSGMVAAYGAARPYIVDITAPPDTTSSGAQGLQIAEGWRIAWTKDGTRLAIGAPPDVIADDAPSARWRLVDPSTGAARGVADTASFARGQWIEGPNLDVATAVDMKQRRAFRSGDVDIESEDGWIRVYARDGARLRAARIIGPGIALTATANGQFIVAIAPDPKARSYDPPNYLVVYHILRR